MEEFEKEQKILDLNETDKNNQLLEIIYKAKEELKQAHLNFEAADKELIDYYTYQIKASQAKLDYLTQLAKKSDLGSVLF